MLSPLADTTTLAFNPDHLIWIVPLAAVAVIVILVGFFRFCRFFEEVGLSARSGWGQLARSYQAPNDFDGANWSRSSSIRITRHAARRGTLWYRYVNVSWLITPAGLALRYGGRFRPYSKPHAHPVLLFPWSEMSSGEFRNKNMATVAAFTLKQHQNVAIGFRREDGPVVAAQSGGRWTLTPPPPPSWARPLPTASPATGAVEPGSPPPYAS